MTNDQMKANRFGRWYTARKRASAIVEHLINGGVVMVCTALSATQLDNPKHATMIKGTKTGLYIQRGKKWECIDYCSIKFYGSIT